MRKSRGLLLALSGARTEVLDLCPSERIKFESLGWAILITSGMATVSMWFALSSAMGVNPVLAFPIAVVWGLAIMGIDRWLVTSIPPSGTRRLAIALPRLLLAVLLGSLISTPIVLRIFQSEINNQIIQIDTQRQDSYVAQQQHSTVNQQVATWKAQVSSLQGVINSHGQQPVDLSSDPVYKELSSEQNYWVGQEQKYYRQWQCQLYGGPGCPAGNGVLAHNSEQAYDNAKQQVNVIQGELTDRKNTLTADSAKSASTRLAQAQVALPQAQQELANYQAQQDTLRNANFATLPRNGLLIRLQALDALSAGNFTVNVARFLLFLLFLVIECLPVTVKLLQHEGNYEKILQAEREHELRNARRAFRIRPQGGPGAFPGVSRPAEDVSVHDIWHRPEFAGTLAESDAPQFGFPYPADSPRGHREADTEELIPPADEALRGMEDDRVSAGSDGHSGGIPLRWDDE